MLFINYVNITSSNFLQLSNITLNVEGFLFTSQSYYGHFPHLTFSSLLIFQHPIFHLF